MVVKKITESSRFTAVPESHIIGEKRWVIVEKLYLRAEIRKNAAMTEAAVVKRIV